MNTRRLREAGASPAPNALLERLLAAVRPEFRAARLEFPTSDPVFGSAPCRVPNCPRPARGQGLCQGHHQRWVRAGRPDLDVFVATTDPRWRRQRPNLVCGVGGCGYGVARRGLCQLHAQRWERAGRPDLTGWVADRPAGGQPATGTVCRIGHCALWPEAGGLFCYPHTRTWKANGRPEVAMFVAGFADVGIDHESIRLSDLGPQLRLEIQYALQCRHDERATQTPPAVVMQVARFLAGTAVTSLLERSERDWRGQIGRPAPKDSNPRALLAYAHRKVADLAEADGWDAEFPRDVWQLRRLGFPGNQTFVFTGIGQPWLRELVKRWLRGRLASGVGLEAARRGLRSLTRFAGFLDHTGISGLAELDRGVLERYLADLRGELVGRQRHGDQIGQLGGFLRAIRQHGWDPSLPPTALIFSDDYPHRAERPPRALAEHVMAQLEHADNLARWPNPAYRLATLILMRAGLRVSDALRLPSDCLVADSAGAPYLRYFNHKMRREALVPIDEELRALIAGQQAHVGAAPVLFPRPTKNPDRTAPVSSSTYRLALYQWLTACDVRDAAGQPVHLTPHQWRHTLGTRLINRDVPQEVVRRILDHDSAQMTAHYARLHDTTVRRHWEAARKVDIRGQRITLDPDGPLAEAAWAKQRLSRATQALPNGYCSLPVVKTCPHANACLTCPMFLTTAEFLPHHREQRAQVIQLVTAAQARGQTRLAEMNQQVAANLDRIITSLENDPPDRAADAT